MNSKTVLVTGANGFVGKHLVRHLGRCGWSVLRASREAPHHADGVALDLEAHDLDARLARLAPVDAVVHLAAKVDFANAGLSDLWRTNVLATAKLADFAKLRGIPLVFMSTAIVAGVRTARVSPDSVPNPDTPYAKSKALAEEMIQASGVAGAILRAGGIFGLGGPSHLGLNRAIQSAVSGAAPEIVGDGTSLRNYIYVKDAAAAIADVLKNGLSGTHLLAGSENLSIAQMVTALCDVFLPEAEPRRVSGGSASDQLIDPSPDLPKSRPFLSALEDIRADLEK